MTISTLRSIVTAVVIAAVAFSSAARPAKADTATTLLLTAAAVAAIATEVNVSNKNAKAHTVVGYLQNGSVVFADGHVLAPNGQSWYPGNVGQSIACNGQYCSIVGGYGYGGGGYPAYGNYQNGGYPSGYAPTRTINTVSTTTTIIRRDPVVRIPPGQAKKHDSDRREPVRPDPDGDQPH